MALASVITKDSVLVIARCTRCQGIELCVLESFMTGDDRRTALKLQLEGFKLLKVSVSNMPSTYSCECKPSVRASAELEVARAVEKLAKEPSKFGSRLALKKNPLAAV